jgi:hypothetical protein
MHALTARNQHRDQQQNHGWEVTHQAANIASVIPAAYSQENQRGSRD